MCPRLLQTKIRHQYTIEINFLCCSISDFGANINYQVLPLGLSFNQLPNGSLSIAGVTKETEGMYTCTAQNGVRTGISKTINVTVNGMHI